MIILIVVPSGAGTTAPIELRLDAIPNQDQLPSGAVRVAAARALVEARDDEIICHLV